MSIDIFLAYSLAVVLLTASPDPMVLLSMKHGLEAGIKGTFISALTGMICICLMMTLCFYGVSKMLQSNLILKNALLISGVLYIAYLGVQSILHANKPHQFNLSEGRHHQGVKSIVKEMSISAWTNPKDWIFFGLFLPQFMNASKPLLPQLSIMLITFAVCEFFFLSLYGSLSFYFSKFFEKYVPVYKKILGAILILLAFLMAYHTYTS